MKGMEMDGIRGRLHPAGERGAALSDEAIVRLWHAHRRWVAAVIWAHKPRDADVDDLLQDVAVKLVNNIHALSDPESIRPWLRTVAVNIARSAGRRSRSAGRAHHAVAAATAPDRSAGPGREPIDQPGLVRSIDDARSRGRRALELAEGLPTAYREPLVLSLRGLSQRQIADALDVPVTTVETRLIRARRMLREELAAEESRRGAATTTAPLPVGFDS
jgi:RNA polymerase sigma-70 factor (ECF subfamily)